MCQRACLHKYCHFLLHSSKVTEVLLACALKASLLSLIFIECISHSAVLADECAIHPLRIH